MNILDWEEVRLARLVEIGEKTATISVEKLTLLIGFARASIDHSKAVAAINRSPTGELPHDLIDKRCEALDRKIKALVELTKEE